VERGRTGREGYGPAAGVEHVLVRIADAGVGADLAQRVDDLADRVAAAVADGDRVLVRCSGGLNRSGLVTAAALVRLGSEPDGAIALVRRARGPWALTNPVFVAHLRTLTP
jgi:protein-tyrosine phosphatase